MPFTSTLPSSWMTRHSLPFMLDQLLGCPLPLSAGDQMETFHTLIEDNSVGGPARHIVDVMYCQDQKIPHIFIIGNDPVIEFFQKGIVFQLAVPEAEQEFMGVLRNGIFRRSRNIPPGNRIPLPCLPGQKRRYSQHSVLFQKRGRIKAGFCGTAHRLYPAPVRRQPEGNQDNMYS